MKKLLIILGVCIALAIIIFFAVISLREGPRYKFATYDDFVEAGKADPENFGMRGNVGSILSIPLVPECAENIMYHYNLDTNIATLRFKCEEYTEEDLESNLSRGNWNFELRGHMWTLSKRKDSTFFLTATPFVEKPKEAVSFAEVGVIVENLRNTFGDTSVIKEITQEEFEQKKANQEQLMEPSQFLAKYPFQNISVECSQGSPNFPRCLEDKDSALITNNQFVKRVGQCLVFHSLDFKKEKQLCNNVGGGEGWAIYKYVGEQGNYYMVDAHVGESNELIFVPKDLSSEPTIAGSGDEYRVAISSDNKNMFIIHEHGFDILFNNKLIVGNNYLDNIYGLEYKIKELYWDGENRSSVRLSVGDVKNVKETTYFHVTLTADTQHDSFLNNQINNDGWYCCAGLESHGQVWFKSDWSSGGIDDSSEVNSYPSRVFIVLEGINIIWGGKSCILENFGEFQYGISTTACVRGYRATIEGLENTDSNYHRLSSAEKQKLINIFGDFVVKNQ